MGGPPTPIPFGLWVDSWCADGALGVLLVREYSERMAPGSTADPPERSNQRCISSPDLGTVEQHRFSRSWVRRSGTYPLRMVGLWNSTAALRRTSKIAGA